MWSARRSRPAPGYRHERGDIGESDASRDSSQRGAHGKAFDDTVVDGDDAIVEEARQRHVVVDEVLNRFAHRR